MPTATTAPSLSLNDLLRLGRIEEDPRFQSAHAQLADAEHAAVVAAQRHADAQTERHAAETAAAEGRRDDKRLRRAQEEMDAAASELRIATRALERAQRTATEVYDDVCCDVHRALRAHYRPAIEALDRALAEAKQCSDAVARIEDVSRALLAGGPYRTHPGSPLPHGGSWSREFGLSSGNESRYSHWRKSLGLR